MSYNSRPSTFNTTNPPTTRPSLTQPASSALQSRITQKRAELENLTQLRDLSANLTSQLEVLEAKLGSLKDGAQSVALVLANWENVLGVIRMVGMRAASVVPKGQDGREHGESSDGDDGQKKEKEKEQELPVPLVRIPVQVQQQEEQKPDAGG